VLLLLNMVSWETGVQLGMLLLLETLLQPLLVEAVQGGQPGKSKIFSILKLFTFSEHKYNPDPVLEAGIKQKLTTAIHNEKKSMNTYYKDLVAKQLKNMSFKRSN